MALPLRGSRPIDIDGVPYRWMLREVLQPEPGDPHVVFVVVAQRADGSGPHLHGVLCAGGGFGHYASGCKYDDLTPGHVARWLRALLRRSDVDWTRPNVYDRIPVPLTDKPRGWP